MGPLVHNHRVSHSCNGHKKEELTETRYVGHAPVFGSLRIGTSKHA